MSSNSKVTLLDSTSLIASVTGDSKSLEPKWKNTVGFIKISNYAAGTFTAKIQHSPNGVDWFDLKAFTGALAANTSELQFVTGAVLGQVRADVVAASSPDADVLVELYYDRDK